MIHRLFLFSILLISTQILANEPEICTSRDIMKLMIKKGLWKDPRQSKVCLDLSGLPNVRMYLEDGTYDVHGTRKADYKKEQDASVKKVYDLFEASIPLDQRANAPFSVKTKGYADGVFGSASFDDEITRDLMPNGKLDYSSLEELIKNRNKDEKGFNSIVALVKTIKGFESFGHANPNGPDMASIEKSRALHSQLRNVYEAKSRGEELCNGIFGEGASESKCTVEAFISPNLDRGKNCIDGCCDGRRGAVVDISLPVLEEHGHDGNGKYYPPFNLAAKNTQISMQTEASLKVVNLPIVADEKLDKLIKSGDFLSEDVIKQDRERFKTAMKAINCDTSDMTVDHFRRIYWGYHLIKDQVSYEVKNAIEKNDLEAILKLQPKSNTSHIDKSAILAVQTGGHIIKLNRVTMNCDSTSEVAPWKKKKDIPKELIDCSVISSGDEQWFKDQGINNLHDLSLKVLESKTSHVVAAAETGHTGNFWFYDEVAQRSHYFTMDRSCAVTFAPGTFSSISTKGNWPKKVVDPTKDKYSESCFKQNYGTLPEPNKYNVPNFLTSFTPSAAQAGEGRPTDYLNCLPVNKSYDRLLSNGGFEAEKTQRPFCEVQGNNQLSLGMDPDHMNEVTTAVSNKKIKGHICLVCESGTSYDPKTKKLVHLPRSRKWKRYDIGDVLTRWDETSNPNLTSEPTLGASKRLMTYLIPNCGTTCDTACACLKEGNIGKLMRDAEKFDFYDKTLPTELQVQKYKGDGSSSFACMFSPPVSATCMVSPQGSGDGGEANVETKSNECLVVEKLKSMPEVIPVIAAPTDTELDALESSCSNSKNFPADEATCENQTNPLCYNKRKEVAEQCGEPKRNGGNGSSNSSAQ